MSDPMNDPRDLAFMIFAGIVATLVAWRPRQILRWIFGRNAVRSASERVIRFDQAMAAMVAVFIAAMLIIHFFFPQFA